MFSALRRAAPLLLLAAVAVLLVALPSPVWAATVLHAGFSFPVVSRSLDDLRAMSQPRSTPGQGIILEAIPWVIYDTQTYTSGTTTSLTFFQAPSSDPTLTNMNGSGTLPEPQFFELYYMGLDVLEPVISNATGVASAWTDVQLLMMDATARSVFTFSYANKSYGPIPLSFLHASGGVQGQGFNEAAAGTVKLTYANNSIPDGGFCWNGSVVIPPSTNFGVTANWAAAATLIADRRLRCWMSGVLHRRVG